MNRLLIVDLESTCFETGQEPLRFFSEIIEIGAVVFDFARGEVIDEFQCFVRPVLFPVLSDFCRKLTRITQEQVDSGWPLSRALAEIGRFQREHEAVFASWGDYDRKQFERVCSRFGLPYPISSRHINLKQEHADHYGVKRMGVAGALRFHRLKLEGIHHRGIDDARNIARIVMQMVRDGWMHE